MPGWTGTRRGGPPPTRAHCSFFSRRCWPRVPSSCCRRGCSSTPGGGAVGSPRVTSPPRGPSSRYLPRPGPGDPALSAARGDRRLDDRRRRAGRAGGPGRPRTRFLSREGGASGGPFAPLCRRIRRSFLAPSPAPRGPAGTGRLAVGAPLVVGPAWAPRPRLLRPQSRAHPRAGGHVLSALLLGGRSLRLPGRHWHRRPRRGGPRDAGADGARLGGSRRGGPRVPLRRREPWVRRGLPRFGAVVDLRPRPRLRVVGGEL